MLSVVASLKLFTTDTRTLFMSLRLCDSFFPFHFLSQFPSSTPSLPLFHEEVSYATKAWQQILVTNFMEFHLRRTLNVRTLLLLMSFCFASNEIETEIYALNIVRDPNDYYIRPFLYSSSRKKKKKRVAFYILFQSCYGFLFFSIESEFLVGKNNAVKTH